MAEATIDSSSVQEVSTAIVYTAVQQCLDSDVLKLSSVKALTSLTLCKDFSINFSSNHDETQCACKEIVHLLSKCIPSATKLSKRWRERMWKGFHCTRTSSAFKSVWFKLFLTTIGTTVDIEPLSQHLTDIIFHNMLKPVFATDTTIGTSTPAGDLNDDEENTLRYIGGYIVTKVKKMIVSSNHTLRKELLIGLNDLIDSDRGNEGGSSQ